MAGSSKGMQECYKTGGREKAMKYCQAWQKEVEQEGKELSDRFKKGEIDMKLYNKRRLSLNQRTAELNNCVSVLNKLV